MATMENGTNGQASSEHAPGETVTAVPPTQTISAGTLHSDWMMFVYTKIPQMKSLFMTDRSGYGV